MPEKASRVFSRKDVSEELRGIVDITEREISYWMDLEIVVPDIANPQGQGKTRYHSIYNLIDFAIAKKLALAGMNLKTIKSVMEYIRSDEKKEIYLSDEDQRLIIVNPNTADMRVYLEGADPYPSFSDRKAFASRLVDDRMVHEFSKYTQREMVLVGQKFESLFVLNITPMVKKVLGIAQ